MSRSFLLDARYQHFVTEQYEKEARARIKFYEDTKAGREYTRKSYVIGLPTIDPMQYALRKKKEEDETKRRIVQEARDQQVKEEMWPIEPVTRQRLYNGLSIEGDGRYDYLKERANFSPEEKFTFPLLSSWQYGWKLRNEPDSYHKPKHARTAKIEESFYSRNGVPALKDPMYSGGVCIKD